VKFSVGAFVGLKIKVIVGNARCNNKDNTLPSYTTISNTAVGNTIYNYNKFYAK